MHWLQIMATFQQSNTRSADQAEQKFLELLRGFDFAMLVSHAGQSQLHARPMAIASSDADGTLWFLTGADTAKAFEAAKNSDILAVMQGSSKYLSVAGTAELSHDREKIRSLWKESFRPWFDGKDDPNILLLALKPRDAEYWDNAGLQGVKFALRFAKAYVTGGELTDADNDVKTHAKVQL
jgi:general stress protein 26